MPENGLRELFVFPGAFVAMRIMSRLTVKLSAVLGRMLASRRESAAISLSKVEMMIHVAVEVFRPVEPRARPYKYPA
jgi:hypothetical protein